MKVFILVDNKGGRMFFGKRQSRDSLLIEDVLKTVGEESLYITPYSAPLFEGAAVETESFPSDGYFFNETLPLKENIEKIDTLIIYKWNRDYPADFYLDIDPKAEGFTLSETSEFSGSSHEKITKEIYTR